MNIYYLKSFPFTWNEQKWCVAEVDWRLSEIQGLLELSVQRSSCERDHHKDRLFIYAKGHGLLPLSTSTIGTTSTCSDPISFLCSHFNLHVRGIHLVYLSS